MGFFSKARALVATASRQIAATASRQISVAGRQVADLVDPSPVGISGVLGESSDGDLVKARSLVPTEPGIGPKALYYDPFLLLEQLGWKERPSTITYDTLQSLAYRVPVYTAILQTRINQVRSFASVQHDPREAGFAIRLRDKEQVPKKSDLRIMEEFEEWILNLGVTNDPDKVDFESFLCQITRDAMIYDQACFEIVRNRKGEPADVYVVDGATIRRVDVRQPVQRGKPAYVQIYNNMVYTDFTSEELCFGVRNPRSDIRVHGYGISEIEMGVSIITAMLYTFAYNNKIFSNGCLPKGVLNLPGLPVHHLKAFQRQWYQVVHGVQNAWRTPILNANELQYVNFQQSNRDMEFGAWMDWQIKVFSAICQFDPAEINFLYGNVGQSSSLFQAPAEQRIKESKDRGLKPLLRSIAKWINTCVIWPIAKEYELVFMGIDPKEGERWTDIASKEVKFLKTIDELRAERDLEPLPDKTGEVILDPQWMQHKTQLDMAKQQQEQQGQSGWGQEGEGQENKQGWGDEGQGWGEGETEDKSGEQQAEKQEK